ncbi:MAG: N-acetyltransferase [Chloroflexota bacterium]|nr:MAG: N-acetyltransferase [Chloroflexota bacterium]
MHSGEIQIRQFSLADSDLNQILRIENASFLAVDAYSLEDIKRLHAVCAGLNIVADVDGEIAGYMMTCIHPDRGDIYSLAVNPAYRRKGIGEALFDYTLLKIKEKGLKKIELEVRKTNNGGKSFWERMGFFQVDTLPDFYEDGAEALLMRRWVD